MEKHEKTHEKTNKKQITNSALKKHEARKNLFFFSCRHPLLPSLSAVNPTLLPPRHDPRFEVLTSFRNKRLGKTKQVENTNMKN